MNAPIRLPRPAEYDKAHELKLVEKIATTITENSLVDGVLVLRSAETANALIANLGFALSRDPPSVQGSALVHSGAAQ